MTTQAQLHSRTDQQRIVERYRQPAADFPSLPIESDESVIAAFERIARDDPEKIALKQNDSAITYRQLDEKANRLARALLAYCGPGEGPGALLYTNSIEAVILMLAARKAGKFFAPLEVTLPPERLATILGDFPTPVLLAQTEHASLGARLAEGCRAALLTIADGDGHSDENLGVPTGPDSLFCVLYTSGTTGVPKGIMIDERTLRHTLAVNGALMSRYDRVAHISSFAFLAAMGTLFATLLNGATGYLFDAGSAGHDALLDWFLPEGITFCSPTPTLFRQLAANLPEGFVFPAIRMLRLGTERVLEADLALFRRHFSPASLLRIAYGTSETGILAEHFITRETEIDTAVAPVGFPVPGVTIMLVDEAGRTVPPGEVGEVVVRARHLARGYWNDPQRTAERFTVETDPDNPASCPPLRRYHTGDLGRFLPNGMLALVGRADNQFKLRGHRIEPAEIEGVLERHPQVRSAVVAAREDRAGQTWLVAYLVCKGSEPSVSDLRCFVGRSLPEHMIPQCFIFLAALPTYPNGKVHLNALPKPSSERPSLHTPYVAPRTEPESWTRAVWQNVLQIEQIGVDDSFLELGGSSLQAFQIVADLKHSFGVDVSPPLLLAARTVAKMAALLTDALAASALTASRAERTVDVR